MLKKAFQNAFQGILNMFALGTIIIAVLCVLGIIVFFSASYELGLFTPEAREARQNREPFQPKSLTEVGEDLMKVQEEAHRRFIEETGPEMMRIQKDAIRKYLDE